jgi:hypothetical protein
MMDVFVVYAGDGHEMNVQGVYSSLQTAKDANKKKRSQWYAAYGGWKNDKTGEDARLIAKFGLDCPRF